MPLVLTVLKPGCHLADMRGIALHILVTGDKQCRWIVHVFADSMVWRLGIQSVKVIHVLNRAIFLSPLPGIAKLLVAEHIQNWCDA